MAATLAPGLRVDTEIGEGPPAADVGSADDDPSEAHLLN
jgi:hypothetical protein